MQCNRTRSLDLFFATVPQATPPVLGLLGCGCSVASEPVAEIIHHWNISQVQY
jgi:gamma-aminobutyric acid type B receptor